MRYSKYNNPSKKKARKSRPMTQVKRDQMDAYNKALLEAKTAAEAEILRKAWDLNK